MAQNKQNFRNLFKRKKFAATFHIQTANRIRKLTCSSYNDFNSTVLALNSPEFYCFFIKKHTIPANLIQR